MLFWQLHCEAVRLFRAFLPSWLPHEHFEALDFKIMFLANSVHLGFWNISWTYSPPPKKLFLWKIAFVCRAGPFVLGDAMSVFNVTFAIPCKQACAATLPILSIPKCMDVWQTIPFSFVKCNFELLLFCFVLLLYENVSPLPPPRAPLAYLYKEPVTLETVLWPHFLFYN